MPIKNSPKKALRQSLKRKTRNIRRKRAIKDLTKEIQLLVSKKKIKEAKDLIPKAYKLFDKAAKVNLIKKNTASRKKSRIQKLVAKAG